MNHAPHNGNKEISIKNPKNPQNTSCISHRNLNTQQPKSKRLTEENKTQPKKPKIKMWVFKITSWGIGQSIKRIKTPVSPWKRHTDSFLKKQDLNLHFLLILFVLYLLPSSQISQPFHSHFSNHLSANSRAKLRSLVNNKLFSTLSSSIDFASLILGSFTNFSFFFSFSFVFHASPLNLYLQWTRYGATLALQTLSISSSHSTSPSPSSPPGSYSTDSFFVGWPFGC